jgi:hypothetical protein
MTTFTSHAGVFFNNDDLISLKTCLAEVVPGPDPIPPDPTPGPWPIPGAVCVDMPWAAVFNQKIGLTCADKLVVRFTVPTGATTTPPGGGGRLSFVEALARNIYRVAVLSTVPLDFDTSHQSTKWNMSAGAGPAFILYVGTTQVPNYPTVVPGTTYYVNLRMTNRDGTPSCSPATLDVSMLMNFNLPR